MLRGILFLVFLILVAFVASWMADRPGSVVIEWEGNHVETSFALLTAGVAALMLAAGIVFRLWGWLAGLPERIRHRLESGRQRKGHLALTRGLVAVAAGDVQGARNQAWLVEKYIKEPPLTLLLSAQAAQLAGDDAQARRFFKQMCDNPETEFFGLRGLIIQAMKQGAFEEARMLSERAWKINPKSPWVAATLLPLQARFGRWTEARETVTGSAKGLLPPESRKRHEAVIEYQMGEAAAAAGDLTQAQRHLRKALDLRSGFVPAAVRLAGLLTGAGKTRKAAEVVEAAWRIRPHPDLFEAFCTARKAEDPMARVQAAQRLNRVNPDHAEGHAILGAAALAASLWGEARRHLRIALDKEPTAGLWRQLAEVEETEPEQGDPLRARQHLLQAASAAPDPAWVCEACGHVAPRFAPLCASCSGFDTLVWRVPSHSSSASPAIPSQTNIHTSRPIN